MSVYTQSPEALSQLLNKAHVLNFMSIQALADMQALSCPGSVRRGQHQSRQPAAICEVGWRLRGVWSLPVPGGRCAQDCGSGHAAGQRGPQRQQHPCAERGREMPFDSHRPRHDHARQPGGPLIRVALLATGIDLLSTGPRAC